MPAEILLVLNMTTPLPRNRELRSGPLLPKAFSVVSWLAQISATPTFRPVRPISSARAALVIDPNPGSFLSRTWSVRTRCDSSMINTRPGRSGLGVNPLSWWARLNIWRIFITAHAASRAWRALNRDSEQSQSALAPTSGEEAPSCPSRYQYAVLPLASRRSEERRVGNEGRARWARDRWDRRGQE